MCGEGVAGDEVEEGVSQIAKEVLHHTKEFGSRESIEIFKSKVDI